METLTETQNLYETSPVATEQKPKSPEDQRQEEYDQRVALAKDQVNQKIEELMAMDISEAEKTQAMTDRIDVLEDRLETLHQELITEIEGLDAQGNESTISSPSDLNSKREEIGRRYYLLRVEAKTQIRILERKLREIKAAKTSQNNEAVADQASTQTAEEIPTETPIEETAAISEPSSEDTAKDASAAEDMAQKEEPERERNEKDQEKLEKYNELYVKNRKLFEEYSNILSRLKITVDNLNPRDVWTKQLQIFYDEEMNRYRSLGRNLSEGLDKLREQGKSWNDTGQSTEAQIINSVENLQIQWQIIAREAEEHAQRMQNYGRRIEGSMPYGLDRDNPIRTLGRSFRQLHDEIAARGRALNSLD